MNRSKHRSFLLGIVAFALFLFSGCSFAGQMISEILSVPAEPQTYTISNYGIEVPAPQGWEETGAENLDLQLYNSSIGMYMSIYGYTDDEFDEGTSPEDVLELQSCFILDRRDQVQEIEGLETKEYGDKTVYTVLYSAEKDGHQNYYRFSLLDFKSSDKMAWVLFTAMPSDIIAYSDTISELIANITVTSEVTSF
ncbi:MAG: hypothetical protein DBY25_05395 [Clostridiales bacterium]|nr:MAG: hypothetical protein DBY25_05395 [Clostridiales bacterium]